MRITIISVLAVILLKPVPQANHTITVSWQASTTVGVKYNLYRRYGVPGPPWHLQNYKPTSHLSMQQKFTESQVGETYCYAATAVTSAGVQSVYSHSACATVE